MKTKVFFPDSFSPTWTSFLHEIGSSKNHFLQQDYNHYHNSSGRLCKALLQGPHLSFHPQHAYLAIWFVLQYLIKAFLFTSERSYVIRQQTFCRSMDFYIGLLSILFSLFQPTCIEGPSVKLVTYKLYALNWYPVSLVWFLSPLDPLYVFLLKWDSLIITSNTSEKILRALTEP